MARFVCRSRYRPYLGQDLGSSDTRARLSASWLVGRSQRRTGIIIFFLLDVLVECTIGSLRRRSKGLSYRAMSWPSLSASLTGRRLHQLPFPRISSQVTTSPHQLAECPSARPRNYGRIYLAIAVSDKRLFSLLLRDIFTRGGH